MLERVTQEIIDDVRTELEKVATITGEDHGPRRVLFHRMPRLDVSTKRWLDVDEALIRKYCNPPYTMYSDNSVYRFTLTCN